MKVHGEMQPAPLPSTPRDVLCPGMDVLWPSELSGWPCELRNSPVLTRGCLRLGLSQTLTIMRVCLESDWTNNIASTLKDEEEEGAELPAR